jgi:peptide/nickel transport system substrate-binding protein
MIDPATVQIICFKPKADMTRLWVPILPKHIWSKVGAAKVEAGYINRPPIVGSGPFQVAEFKRGRYVRMTRSDNYWGKKPAIDEIIFQVYQNSDTLVQDLKAGTIDAAWEIPQAQLGALKAQKGVEPVPYNYFNWDYLSFNCYASQDSLGNPVLRDPAFRRALNYAVDREGICKITWQGHAVPGTTIIPPNSWKNPDYHWQPPADQLYTFDLAKAAQLLDDAGYPLKNGVRVDKQSKPIKLRLWALNSDIHGQSEGKLIAGWFGRLGLRIVYSVIDEGALEDRLWEFEGDTYTPNFDMYLWDWDGYNDPGQTLSTVMSDQIGSWNEPCWSNAQYDQLAAEQASTMDLDKRKQFIDQLQQIMYDQSPWLVLTYPEHLEAYNTDKWTGWTRVMDGRGPAFYSAGNVDTYLNLQPQAVEKTSRGNGLTIALIGVAAVVVLGSISVWLFLRRRVKAEED